MKKIVVKFGGSNLKNKEDIQNIIRVIKMYNKPLVIVVSAFYGITNQLQETISRVKDDENYVNLFTAFLSDMKRDIINEYVFDRELKETVISKISQRLEELARYFRGINYIGDVPDFLEDNVLSYGERLSSVILTYILKQNGIDCEEALPEDLKLITDGEFGNASVNFALAEQNVKEKLSDDRVFVVPGFYGISESGKVTLFGRGGSDYSAASIARCIDAESLDLWKDVSGFLSADPRIVDSPERIHNLSYEEAAEISYFGAKILHPRTVEPLMDRDIPIRVFNIYDTDAEMKPLTIIDNQQVIRDGIVKNVTFSDDFSVLKLKSPSIGINSGILAKLSARIDKAGINIKSVVASQTEINILLSKKDLPKAYRVTKDIVLPGIYELHTIDDISTVAVVGAGFIDAYGIAARILNAVARKKINLNIIASGLSDVMIYFTLAKKDRIEAVKQIHDEFFPAEKKNKSKAICEEAF